MRFAIALAGLIFFIGCNSPQNSFQTEDGNRLSMELELTAKQQLKIIDESGSAVADADVLIGSQRGVPFAANLLKSDKAGIVSYPSDWVDAQPLSVSKPGYVTTTWLATVPQSQSLFVIRKEPSSNKFELTGETTGYKNLQTDDWLDFGLVFPLLSYDQLASLQVSDLVSLDTDAISIFGYTVNIPSNISIPEQQEHYIFTVTIDKPVYRSYVNTSGSRKFAALHGHFPFESVVDEIRAGKSFLDVINRVEFLDMSVRDIQMSSSSTPFNFPIDDIQLKMPVTVVAPQLPTGQNMLAVSVTERNGLLAPSDIKTLASGETKTLKSTSSPQDRVVAVTRNQKASLTGAVSEAMSVSFLQSNQTSNLSFLTIPNSPSLTSGKVNLTPPQGLGSTLQSDLTYLVLSDVTTHQMGKSSVETKTPKWEIYARGWINVAQLPQITLSASQHPRWQALFAASTKGSAPVDMAPGFVSKMTKVAKSALDF